MEITIRKARHWTEVCCLKDAHTPQATMVTYLARDAAEVHYYVALFMGEDVDWAAPRCTEKVAHRYTRINGVVRCEDCGLIPEGGRTNRDTRTGVPV